MSARARMNGVFVVIPGQFDDDEPIVGLKFKDASKAGAFADGVRKFANRLYRKLNDTAPDTDVNGVAFDILVQNVTPEGEPNGDPMILNSLRDQMKGSKPKAKKAETAA
jgi:hypothetical protein